MHLNPERSPCLVSAGQSIAGDKNLIKWIQILDMLGWWILDIAQLSIFLSANIDFKKALIYSFFQIKKIILPPDGDSTWRLSSMANNLPIEPAERLPYFLHCFS
jgi:hypothetical protein